MLTMRYQRKKTAAYPDKLHLDARSTGAVCFDISERYMSNC
jgi:hypothetical protein